MKRSTPIAWASPAHNSFLIRFFDPFLGPIAILMTAIGMLYWTWGTWPDVLVDFGRELYIPWQLAEGKVLYRDIACFQGPLSQYVNAAWFFLFGPSLRTLVLCNLVLVGLLIGLLYYLFKQVGSRWSSIAACLTFVLLFAFAQYVLIGNYNYVCPYAHEMIHGLALSLAAMFGAWQYRRYGLPVLGASGVALGLAFLTKAEVFLPGLLATVVALFLTIWDMRPSLGRALGMVGAVIAGAVVPPGVAFACLSLAMPTPQALTGVLGTWAAMAHTNLNQRQLVEGIGFDNIARNVGLQLLWIAVYFAIVFTAGLLGLMLRKPGTFQALVSMAVFFIFGSALWTSRHEVVWHDAARPLPLVMLVLGIYFSVQFFRHRPDGPSRELLVRQISLTVFAFVLLGKIILNSRIYHYGYVLAMPATLVLVVTLLDWAPAAISSRGGSGAVFRAAVLSLLVVAGVSILSAQGYFLHGKNYQVGKAKDAFWADKRGRYVNAVMDEIACRTKADETVAVLPEGVTINFLCRRRNPTPYVFFMPFDVGLFGEEQMLTSFQDHPPDWIVIVPKNTDEYGYRGFGLDYGQQIVAWVWQNYEEVWWIGVPSLEKVRFGISLMRKKKRDASLITSPRTNGIDSNQSGVHGAAWANLPCTKPLVFTTRVP